MNSVTLDLPDDWHVHLRDGAVLADTVPAATRQFGRGVVMPNLRPPVTTVAQAEQYRERILAASPPGSVWEPLMTLYLTDNTPATELRAAKHSGIIHAVKYYPAGATTNSDSGVTDLDKAFPLLEEMQALDLPLLLHGEVTDPEVDIFDREAVFIDRHLTSLVKNFPALRLVLEHITTREAAEFIAAAPPNVAATITPQHLLFNRNDLLAGGIRPHFYCLPVLKRDHHRQALVAAATSGSRHFFLGTDSAPHPRPLKEAACGCAGCYSHPAALELYAMAFDRAGALDRLEGFASHFGADFYRLPRHTSTVTLRRTAWRVPDTVGLGQDFLVPLAAGDTLPWHMLPRSTTEEHA
ncbi:MAG: dihydroorotase [Gammaproteobacteria bacterium]|nr:dihydroorotase [Gammaproteobacteria bacterium]